MFERIRDELDLTKEQIKQMDELRSSIKKESIKLNSDMNILQVDQKDALKEFNFKEAKKITGKIFEIKKNLAIKRIEMQEQRWNILDTEQQAKVEEMMQQRGHHKRPFGKTMPAVPPCLRLRSAAARNKTYLSPFSILRERLASPLEPEKGGFSRM